MDEKRNKTTLEMIHRLSTFVNPNTFKQTNAVKSPHLSMLNL